MLVLNLLEVNAIRVCHCRAVHSVKAVVCVKFRHAQLYVWGGLNVRQIFDVWLLHQSLYRSNCGAPERHVRTLTQTQPICLGSVMAVCEWSTGSCVISTVTMEGMLQGAGSSRPGGLPSLPRAGTDMQRTPIGSARGNPPTPETNATRTPGMIVMKVGEPVPEGYNVVVEEQGGGGPSNRIQLQSARETVDLCTPPKTKEPAAAQGPVPAKNKPNANRNLTRNKNRKANTSFAKDLKDSLARGGNKFVKLKVEKTDLRSAWHAAAKEVAYKLLDLRKESWKEYSIFEKGVVHKELNEVYKFDPPLDPFVIDKFLSAHLRTSRAVWKAHWKKYGSEHRHHNCPEEAWASLTKFWPTPECKEEAAEMAGRRSRVERTSNVGRSSLVDRMDIEVRYNLGLHDIILPCFIDLGCPQSRRARIVAVHNTAKWPMEYASWGQ
jgi:cell wall-associated NlpC family hydrolase